MDIELLRSAVLALLACYLVGLLVFAAGLGRLPEPGRYHLGALLILLLMWLFGAAFVFRDPMQRPDLVASLRAFAPLVGLWWMHQLYAHRRRPPPPSPAVLARSLRGHLRK